MGEALGPGGRLVIGVDLKKDPAILLEAYDDRAGVTAAFNLNLLARANRELNARFDLSNSCTALSTTSRPAASRCTWRAGRASG